MGPATGGNAEATEASIRALVRDLGARAAGLWRVEGPRLALVAFVPGPDLPAEVAAAFAEATRSVGLDQAGLGIVQAALGGTAVVSRAAELPVAAGSGRWLRAFGAARSVAVPLPGPEGRPAAVLSVALGEGPPGDARVAERLRAVAAEGG